MMVTDKDLLNLFKAIKKERLFIISDDIQCFYNIHKSKVYVNKEGNYIDIKLGLKEYKFYLQTNEIDVDADYLANDKIQIILLDSIKVLLDILLTENRKAKAKQDKIIDNLFEKLLKRRNLKLPNDKIITKVINKKYI